MMEQNVLEGRVAIVTGGGRGIGKAICDSLINSGARLICADNGFSIDGTEEDNGIIDSLVATYGKSALGYSKSIASPEAAQEITELALKNFGRIDIIVNCAAILRDGLVFKSSPIDWDVVIQNNLSSAYYLINASTPIMRQQFKDQQNNEETYNWGRVINIGSTAGLYGNFGQANYGSAKAGLFALTRITAMEMAPSNVTANYIAPFAHSRVTDMIKPANKEQSQYKERAMRVLPNYVSTFVEYLCSDQAEDVTGQVFGVRAKEIFVFSQPRPINKILQSEGDWNHKKLSQAVNSKLRNDFTDLATDLEAFNTDPII
ncbi:MAG: SDR family NAD(P)-dependent oxidoreductase [Pseudomonadota bacterium]|nr:SDR family NAD(P)-dependent oxidoreductase [Pseudomonadota bacterium]